MPCKCKNRVCFVYVESSLRLRWLRLSHLLRLRSGLSLHVLAQVGVYLVSLFLCNLAVEPRPPDEQEVCQAGSQLAYASTTTVLTANLRTYAHQCRAGYNRPGFRIIRLPRQGRL